MIIQMDVEPGGEKQTIQIDTNLTSTYFLTCPNCIINELQSLRMNTGKSNHVIIGYRALNIALYVALKYSTRFCPFLCGNI